MKAIIGGTGVYGLSGEVGKVSVQTDFGVVELERYVMCSDSVEEVIYFLARHGGNHHIPPHGINYAANIAALKQLGVKEVLATCAVGSMNKDYAPGALVLLTDFIDETKNRQKTLFTASDPVTHVDMSDPYCSRLRKRLERFGDSNGRTLAGNAVYVCTEGPRFETAAEIRKYRMMGADVVGMTNVPEVIFAKEAGICYAAVGIVTNWCTGIEESISGHDIRSIMTEGRNTIISTFMGVFTQKSTPLEDHCACSNSLIRL